MAPIRTGPGVEAGVAAVPAQATSTAARGTTSADVAAVRTNAEVLPRVLSRLMSRDPW